MKESRHLTQNYVPSSYVDKNQSGVNKSNISSLKAILNQGRVPLSQYINEKSVKSDFNNQNLTYFDKLKAMFSKGQMKTVRQKDGKTGVEAMDVEQYEKDRGNDQNAKIEGYLNNYAYDKKLNLNKNKRENCDVRYKERSRSMNGKSRPKTDNMQRIQTIANKPQKIDIITIERNYNKAYTQIESQEPHTKTSVPMIIPRFKPLKKEIVNYIKFSPIYTNGNPQIGVLELDETLGCGANATVRIGKQKKTEKLFAVKVYEKYKLIEPIKKKRVFREIEILSKIEHESIIKIYNCYQDKRQIHILFEFIPNAETLQDFLRGHYHDIDPSLKNHIALKLIEAINYLHANGISHRDIKTDNVMIGENGLVKLIDFGFATTVVKGQTHCGTPNYMAPELFCKKTNYNPFKVDVWALGVLLYYLYEGCYPFRGYNEKELSRNISIGAYTFKKCDNDMREVISSILKVDPNERCSTDELEEQMRVLSNF